MRVSVVAFAKRAFDDHGGLWPFDEQEQAAPGPRRTFYPWPTLEDPRSRPKLTTAFAREPARFPSDRPPAGQPAWPTFFWSVPLPAT